jgi:hypothetical protein
MRGVEIVILQVLEDARLENSELHGSLEELFDTGFLCQVGTY